MARRIDSAKKWAHAVKRDIVAIWIAARDPRTPVVAKVVAGMVAAYALSPIDLIPDFIPVLGYLDDIIIVPLGILLAVKLIAPNLMDEYRALAEARQSRPTSRSGLIVIVTIWVTLLLLTAWLAWPLFANHGSGQPLPSDQLR